MKNPITWKTETRRVRDLIEYQGNPRIISDHQMEILQKSLKKFSLAEIPAINTDNTVLAGNQRIKGLALLGKMDEFIDVRVPSRKLTEKEAEEYLLVSNRGGGEWDWEALKSFSPDLLQNVGFTDLDFSRIWDDTLEIIDDEFDEDKALKKARTTKIKVGDMFALGEHRVICGSSEDPEVIKRLVGNKEIDVMNSDIPYNVSLSYNAGVSGKQAYGGSTNDKKTDAEYRTFVSTLLANALSVTKKDGHFAIWSDERYNGMMQDLYKEHGIDFKRTCLWIKDNQNPTPKIAFNKSVEFCTYGVIGDPYIAKNVTNLTEVMNKEVGTGSRQISDIVDLFNIWLVGRLPGQEYEHPTQKPPALYEKFLRRCTKSGDVVLDMTAGSGSLLIACEQMNRVARLCEIEPIFTQLIIHRYEQLTNKKAKKID
ncbi:DNA modification methylase [Candidatus Uhrbacteria bacterium]|nr:DNA modification methylase [Candidatus Uhrbacteria bacterium]